MGTSQDDLWNGIWGILRSYKNNQQDLLPLPNNPAGGPSIGNAGDFDGVCPKSAPVRLWDVTAVLAQDVLPGGTLVYNQRTGPLGDGPINDPTAILYVRTSDIDSHGQLRPGTPIEPLILRANAGDCIQVLLRNDLPNTLPDLDGWNGVPPIVEGFNANDLAPSSRVGPPPPARRLRRQPRRRPDGRLQPAADHPGPGRGQGPLLLVRG